MNNEETFETMSYTKLTELISDFDLSTEHTSNPNRPAKVDLIAILNKYKYDQDVLNGNIDPIEEEVTTTKVAGKSKKQLEREKTAIRKKDLMMKMPVYIVDSRMSQTKDKVIMPLWGNDEIGHHRDIIDLTKPGKRKYVRKGALQNLRQVTITESYQDDFSSTVQKRVVPRFAITPAPGITKQELEALAKSQSARDIHTQSPK